VLVEDDSTLRAGLVEVLASEPDFKVIADFATAEEAIQWDGWAEADVLLADFFLPGLDGVHLIAAAVEVNPDLLAAILTESAQSKNVIAALKAGARGYVVKNDPVFGVVDSIRLLLAGNAPISPLVASQVLDFFNRSGSGARGKCRCSAWWRRVSFTRKSPRRWGCPSIPCRPTPGGLTASSARAAGRRRCSRRNSIN
jgi:DNA-binding NarL/FixJ family response regulator